MLPFRNDLSFESSVKIIEGTLYSFKRRFAIRPIKPSFMSSFRTIPSSLSKSFGRASTASFVRVFLSSFVFLIHEESLKISSSFSLNKNLTKRLIFLSSTRRPTALIFGAISKPKLFSLIIGLSISEISGLNL